MHATGPEKGRARAANADPKTERPDGTNSAEGPSRSQSNRPQLPPLEDAADILADSANHEPPQLIEGILHQGLKFEIAGASKSMKSWFALQIAVCVACGEPLLERFGTKAAKLFFLNLELPKWHFNHRLQLVASRLQVQIQPGMFSAWNLRGHDLGSDAVWASVTQGIIESTPGMVLVDPLYKLFNEFRGENDTTGSGAIMKRFDALAEHTSAATGFTHHYAKGSPANKESIDRFSGSGVLARDPDVYISMTRHAETRSTAFTIELTLRCLPPVDPFVIRWNYPAFELAPDLDPEELRQPPGKREPQYSVDQLVEQLGSDDLSSSEFQKRCRAETGMSNGTFFKLLRQAEAKGLIFKSKVDNKWEVIRSKHA